MSVPKFTPGEWRYINYGIHRFSDGEAGPVIAVLVNKAGTFRNADSNGPLIAAAPDLYAALERLASYGNIFSYKEGDPNPYKAARAALARARGES